MYYDQDDEDQSYYNDENNGVNHMMIDQTEINQIDKPMVRSNTINNDIPQEYVENRTIHIV